MSCVEKRHMSHRVGSMLHHRFPNGFTDLFMDETDREVSTLTDRAFRSLCVGDDAVYNDEFLYGYSPFSCHKPLVGDSLKKTHQKESKKQGQNKQQQQKNISHMSSFLKALSATEESCEGMLIKNGGMTDSKGESWDKSALRSIQRELSEFSSDYHTNLADGHYKNHHKHHSGDGSSNKTGKDVALPSGKSSKIKNGKSTVKLRKLNIKNFFLHSEFSPFQTWRDFNQFPFGQEDTVTSILPTDNIPKWYDLPFYKELTETHRKETVHTTEAQSCQKARVEPPPPTAPKPIPPPPPPKVLPKLTATPAEKRCSSEGGDGSAAPWRRNRSRAKSVIPMNQAGLPPQENSLKAVDESLLLVKKEARSVEVKAVEEVSSLASTPFSICQLMTPLIPSRQPTETSEILQGVLSPSALDLPLRPHSEAKVTPEPPVKRDNYKSLASSILFNLKDNRKRVKSRYSPPKFKTLEVLEGGIQSPQSDHLKHSRAGSEGNTSGLSTPAILKDGQQTVYSPVLESNSPPTLGLIKNDTGRPISDDYLLSHLLQTKKEGAGNSSISEDSPISPFIHSKKTRSPMAKKQNYPSLNLYKKANPVDSDMKYLQVPLSSSASECTDQPTETTELSPLMMNKDLSPKTLPTITGLSPNISNVTKDRSPIISPHAREKEGLSPNVSIGKRPSNVQDNAKQPAKDIKEKDLGAQPVSSREKDTNSQPLSTRDVIRAAREAINAAKNRALSAAQSDNSSKSISDIEEVREKDINSKVAYSKEMFSSNSESSVPENITSQSTTEATGVPPVGKKGNVKKEPPPVPKRNFAKSDIQFCLDKQQTDNVDKLTNGDSGETKMTRLDQPANEKEPVQKRGKLKHVFSTRQNNYIKNQRYAGADDEPGETFEDGDVKVNARVEADEEMSHREMRDSEHIINDLHALKELERARLGDRILENAKNKLSVINIDEEARAKNDLISRELRNIKKGMLSMRGNTSAKRELFTKKEKEQTKPEAFTKTDSNVIVNKALIINDNYDRAKMALEEIISERQKKKNKIPENDANPRSDEIASDESYASRLQQCTKALNNSVTEAKENQNGTTLTIKEKDLKERLGDLRDHNHMRQILSQTEPRLNETHTLGSRIAPPSMDSTELNAPLKTKDKYVNDKLTDDPRDELEEMNLRHIARQISEESGDNLMIQNEGKKGDAPPVPPRSKRGSIKDGSVAKETDSLKDVEEQGIYKKYGEYENDRVHLKEMNAGEHEVDNDLPIKINPSGRSETNSDRERWEVMNNAISKSITDTVNSESSLALKYRRSENTLCSSPQFKRNENEANTVPADLSPTRETAFENITARAKETFTVKRRAPLKPDYLNTPHENVSNSLVTEETDKINRAREEINVDAEALSEIPRNIISPLLLVNGINVNQSPPDQASLSSKSSYFSVESALHRNTETESNVYHSLENLIGEVEEADEVTRNISRNTKTDSDRPEMEYYSLSDHESEPEAVKQRIKSPQKETLPETVQVPAKDKERGDVTTDQSLAHDENNQTPVSPSSTFSPTLGIPALFKVKDNTLSSKMKRTIQPWPPRGILGGSEREDEELHHVKEHPEPPPVNEPAKRGNTPIPDEVKPEETASKSSLPMLPSPSNLQSENPKKPEVGVFLTVPQVEDRFSGVSPSSEGMESTATSTVDTADETGMNAGLLVECEVSKVPSERSGSTCSGNDSQTGLPKPPAVLPKSEKAVLKAMKLTNRRMKKVEAQKSSHKSSQSSNKHKADRHKGDKSEHKSSSSTRSSKSSEKKHTEKTEDGHHHRESHHAKNAEDRSEQHFSERKSHHSERDTKDISHKTRRQSYDSVDSTNQNNEALPSVATERQGRSGNKHIRDKPEQRCYSSDRVISNVPVYKAHISDKPTPDRPFNRSQSNDRCSGDKVERRLSADMTLNERLDPRTQRIEKSIMDELQQRGRARDKAGRDNPLRRSHSIDSYCPEVPHPSNLSRQSSHTSQLSRQSSIEHAIVTQSFPMTQRKLLQDPDSGQYFFVDMPVQVKTKTFFDPETGSYVQLPVKPPEGAVPQASPLEVLTPPLVVYHGFVPVPLSPMAQKATIQAPHMAPEEFEQRHLERSRQMHCKERHPYLEPVYGQHDHVLGEFLGTEELDCPS